MFNVGQKVTWLSSGIRKEGTVVAKVPAGSWPLKCGNFSQFNISALGGGCPRPEDSYLVSVPSKSGKGKPKLYWPRTSWLRGK